MVLKKVFFFFFFLLFFNWENEHGIGEKRWLFSIGNGAEIGSLEMGRKFPGKLDVPQLNP